MKQSAHFAINTAHALRLIDRTNEYDANLFASQLQANIAERLPDVAVSVVARASLVTAVAVHTVPASADFGQRVEDAWLFAVGNIIANHWL